MLFPEPWKFDLTRQMLPTVFFDFLILFIFFFFLLPSRLLFIPLQLWHCVNSLDLSVSFSSSVYDGGMIVYEFFL